MHLWAVVCHLWVHLWAVVNYKFLKLEVMHKIHAKAPDNFCNPRIYKSEELRKPPLRIRVSPLVILTQKLSKNHGKYENFILL